MILRFSGVFLTLILAIIALLIATQHPTGPNTVSFNEPVGLLISLGMLIALFLPPLIMSFFNHVIVKIFSTIYQSFIVISFLFIIPIGFLIPALSVIIIGMIGTFVSLGSILTTIFTGLKKVPVN